MSGPDDRDIATEVLGNDDVTEPETLEQPGGWDTAGWDTGPWDPAARADDATDA